MALKNKEQYIESLNRLHPVVYHLGKRVGRVSEYKPLQPHINSAALTYELACDPQFEDLLVTRSHLSGERINRFTSIHQNREDLVKKVKALRLLAQKSGACFQRCVGWDALNATFSVTFEVDEKHGTDYHQRFLNYLRYVQEEDLMVVGAMTDPKGDRSLKPGQQQDPDMFLRVVERRAEGIVVRGAKLHQTGTVNSHEMLVLPTCAMAAEEKDYAVAFALPVDSKGLIHIFGRQSNDTRRFEEKNEIDIGNFEYGMVGGETMTIFEDVFVPWDRVFLCGECDLSGLLVERFASLHRQNYGGCKTGICDVIIGASEAIAEYNGAEKASHIREKLVEMIQLAETLYACSLSCSYEGYPTRAGSYVPHSMLANVGKQNVTRNIFEVCRLSQDIAGGLLATMPSEADLRNPQTASLILKYLRGRADIPTEWRMRMFRLIENLAGGTALVESLHGAGSPQAQRIMIYKGANLNEKKELAEKLAGIKKEK